MVDNFCNKTHKNCGHRCRGVQNEKRCLPCLNSACVTGFTPSEDQLCEICYTSELGEEPCAKLGCGHVFHVGCIVQLLESGYPTLRMSFGFMSCPSCKAPIDVFDCEPIARVLGPLVGMKKRVEKMALKHAEAEGLFEDNRINTVGDHFFGKPLEYALHRCAFYKCNGCKKPYFGGLIDCMQAAQNDADKTEEDLMCKDCLVKEMGVGQTTCAKHGKKQIDWKCMYCCSTALFHCFGTHFMCNPCHELVCRGLPVPLRDCHGVNCPLGIAHPPPCHDPRKGGVFPLGCGICRSEKLEVVEKYNKLNNGFDEDVEKPKAWIYTGKEQVVIVRPKVEIEVPYFIYAADEIQFKIDNPPYHYQSRAQAAKAKRVAAKKAMKKDQNMFNLPAWFVNPEGEDEEEVAIQAQAATEEAERAAELAKVAEARAKLKKICAGPRVARRKIK